MGSQVAARSTKRDLRFRAALLAGKAAAGALRLAGRAGGQLPGVVAEAICPDFLGRVGKPEHLVFVTGTNGKTTVSNMLGDLLTAVGMDPLTNRAGGNVDTGISSALLKAASLGGEQDHGLAVFELDELSTRRVLPYAQPELLLCTNLYRDSFMRNANPDYIKSVISASVTPGTKLVLNADDLISAGIAPDDENRVYYGVARLPEDMDEPEGIVNDLTACPVCGGRLEYDYCHLRHIGKVRCASCGHTNPEADYLVTAVDREAGTATIRDAATGEERAYRLVAPSIVGIYNLVACVAAARELGVPAADIQRALEQGMQVTHIRFSTEEAGGIRLVNTASKGENSTATSIFFSDLRKEPGRKALVAIIDDLVLEHNPYGSEYTGWHYQSDFEFLADPGIEQIVYYGPRGEDARLRMLLGGVPDERIFLTCDLDEAADLVRLDNIDAVYTAFDVYRSADADRVRVRLKARIEAHAAGEDGAAAPAAAEPRDTYDAGGAWTDVSATQGAGCVVEVLYPEFGNQAGENGNALYLRACLPGAEFVHTAYGEEPAFVTRDVSAVVMGGMTEAHQQLAADALRPYAARLAELADAGVPMLFTHSAAEVLGTTFGAPGGGTHEGLGVLPFATRLDMPKRYLCSFVGTFDPGAGASPIEVLGFKIQFTQMRGNNAQAPFAKVDRGWGLAEGSSYEGFRRGGLIASWLIGPLLTTNPALASWFCEQVTAAPVQLPFADVAQAAYDIRRAELTKPLPKGKTINP